MICDFALNDQLQKSLIIKGKQCMNEVIILADITFSKKAIDSFIFPINNTIRLSFWLSCDKVSTFSEIKPTTNNLNIGKSERVEIKLIERDFLQNRIKNGIEFSIGTYPNEIAKGKIIEII